EAANRAEAKKRKARHAAAATKKAATAPAATQPASPGPSAYLGSDVGGSSGQPSASRSASICSRVNVREPAVMPWQRFPAASQASLSARFPDQNGQVRHWSGLTS